LPILVSSNSFNSFNSFGTGHKSFDKDFVDHCRAQYLLR
jgi:hypothetical protein